MVLVTSGRDRPAKPFLTWFKTELESAQVIRKGNYWYMVHPLLDGMGMDPDMMDLLAERVGLIADDEIGDVHYIVTPEAMGIPLAMAVSQFTRVPVNIVRKREYGLLHEVMFETTTGYSSSRLYLNIPAKAKVYIVDNILSTGGTLDGLIKALIQREAAILGVTVMVDKGDALKRLESRYCVPIKALAKVEVGKQGVKVKQLEGKAVR